MWMWLLGAGMHVSACAWAAERERGRDLPEVGAPARAAPPTGRVERPSSHLGTTGTRPAVEGRNQTLDGRDNRARYYPPVGTVTRSLTGEYRPYYRGEERYYFNGGIWYAPRGAGFVVVRPPPGLVISVLPPFYSTVWFGGAAYYYADDVYYTWQPDQNGYAVVDPPQEGDRFSPAADAAVIDPDGVINPKNAQTREQQAADRLECNEWAKGQTGFDPTQADAGPGSHPADASRSNYHRAWSACMQGRGYEVR